MVHTFLSVPLASAQIEIRQTGHLTERLQAGITHFVAPHGELLQVGQRGQALEAHVRHLRRAHVQRFERGDAGDVCESRVAGFGAVQVQTPQAFPSADGGDAFVGDVFGEIEVEIGDAPQVLDFREPEVGDMGQRQVEVG